MKNNYTQITSNKNAVWAAKRIKTSVVPFASEIPGKAIIFSD